MYTTVARGLTCNKCKRSTTSTKWPCEHGTPWTKCPLHREIGFRCGPLSLNMHKATLDRRNTCPLKASKRHQAKINRLSSLGEQKSPHMSIVNSAGFASRFKTKEVTKKTIKRRQGKRPTPKRDVLQSRPVITQTKLIPSSNRDVILCSGSDLRTKTLNARDQLGGPQYPPRPPKRARTAGFESTTRCRGNCPTIWTITQYCPYCHG